MAAGEFYKGKNLRIRLNGSTLFHATTCSLTITSNVELQGTKDTQGDIVSVGSYNATLSTESLLADKEVGAVDVVDWGNMMQYQLDKTELDFEFSTGVVGDKIISGKMVVTETGLGANNGETSTGSWNFQVNGEITVDTVQA